MGDVCVTAKSRPEAWADLADDGRGQEMSASQPAVGRASAATAHAGR